MSVESFLFLIVCIAVTTFFGNNAQSQTEGSAYLNTTADEAEIESVFLSGLEDLDRGNTDAAIAKFSAILAIDPTLTRVRLELGLAYFRAQQWNRARNEFFTVLSGDLPEAVRSKVLNLIRQIDARRGFDWDMSIGLTNVGNQRDFDTDQILLDFSGVELPFRLKREKSDELGLRVTGSANFRQPLNFKLFGADTLGVAALTFDVTEARTSQYDDYVFGGRLGLRTTAERTTTSFGPVITTRLLGGNVYENRIALEAAFERRNL